MALQLMLGRSGSGKSQGLYEKIIAQAVEHPEKSYFVIVPEQFTMQTQKDLVELHPNKGIFNIDVLSFMRLAYRVFEEQGGLQRTVLEDTGKSLLVRRVITEKQEELKVFQNYAKKPGYISEIKSLLSEFYQYDVKEDTVEQMLALAKDKPMLKRKLEDMQIIYNGFEEQLAEKYITTEEILDVMMEQITRSELLQNTTIALDGFTGFTPVQYRLLGKLMKLCENVVVTVTIDPEEKEEYQQEEFSLFHLSRETINKLKKIAEEEGVEIAKDHCLTEMVPKRFEKSTELACLESGLYRFRMLPYGEYCEKTKLEKSTGDIKVFAGKNMQSEVDFAMREIFSLVKEEGYRYRDIAIVTGDMEHYGRLLEQACIKEKIPCFIDYKKDILKNPMVELIRTLLQMFLRNFDYESTFRYLRSGLVDMEKEHVDKLENYAIALGIKGWSRWNKNWEKNASTRKQTEDEKISQLLEMNEQRERFVEEIVPLRKELGKKENTISAYVVALYQYLVEQKIYKKLKDYEAMFEEQKEPLLAKEYSQVYELVLGVFDKLVQLLGDEKVTLQEFSDLLETGFGEVKVGLIPPGVDQIVVGDIERTRLNHVKALFFLGVNEGIVPKSGSKGGILSDMERELLAEENIALAPTARQTVFTQQFYFYLNLTKPENKLYMTYHKVNQEGKTAMPSGLLRTIQKIFPELGVIEESKIFTTKPLDEKQRKQVLSQNFGKNYLLEGLRTMGEDEVEAWWKELYSYYNRQPNWKEKIDQLVEGVGFVNMENPLTATVAEALYGKKLSNSVTRIEKYAACAYAHFLQYGLQLRERAEFRFQSMDFGNVFHQVLCEFPKELEKKGLGWCSAKEEQVREIVAECMTKVTDQYGNAILASSEKNIYLVERMQRVIQRTIWALATQLKAGSFEPKDYELHFDTLDGLESAKMDLGEGRELRLRGQIDRLDVYEEADKVYVKVIDYKTGKMSFDLTNLYYGLQLQLIVYQNAARELKEKQYKGKEIQTAGLFYYNIDDPIVDRKEAEAEVDQELLKELKMKGLVNADSHIISLLDKEFGDKEPLKEKVRSNVIPVTTKKDGEFDARSTNVATEEEFALLGQFVNEKIEKQGKEILDGCIDISPYHLDKKSACDYCAYNGVCNFDPRLPGNKYRELLKLSKAEAWEAMKKEMNGGEAENGEAGE